jgi:hypothetical protein
MTKITTPFSIQRRPVFVVVIVPSDALKLSQDSLRFYESLSHAGGKTHRGFCPDRGGPIMAQSPADSQVAAIRTASLDDPSWFTPQMDVWKSDAHPWDHMNPALLRFEKYPV